MSRVGSKPIDISEVEIKLEQDLSSILVKGKKGSIAINLFRNFLISINDNFLVVKRTSNCKSSRELHGLLRSLIFNAVQGCSVGFSYNMYLQGIGYRVQKKGPNLEFSLGFSHPVLFEAPDGISFDVQGTDKFTVHSSQKDLIGLVCSKIKSLPRKDSYKGKGIFFDGELIKKKPGKSVK